jgi:hypothetical protein
VHTADNEVLSNNLIPPEREKYPKVSTFSTNGSVSGEARLNLVNELIGRLCRVGSYISESRPCQSNTLRHAPGKTQERIKRAYNVHHNPEPHALLHSSIGTLVFEPTIGNSENSGWVSRAMGGILPN